MNIKLRAHLFASSIIGSVVGFVVLFTFATIHYPNYVAFACVAGVIIAVLSIVYHAIYQIYQEKHIK